MEQQKKTISYRNITLDILKFLACFGVVCIHFGNSPDFLTIIARVCVPFYFLASGFLSANIYDKEDRLKKLFHQIKSLSFYTILAFVIIFIYVAILGGGNILT